MLALACCHEVDPIARASRDDACPRTARSGVAGCVPWCASGARARLVAPEQRRSCTGATRATLRRRCGAARVTLRRRSGRRSGAPRERCSGPLGCCSDAVGRRSGAQLCRPHHSPPCVRDLRTAARGSAGRAGTTLSGTTGARERLPSSLCPFASRRRKPRAGRRWVGRSHAGAPLASLSPRPRRWWWRGYRGTPRLCSDAVGRYSGAAWALVGRAPVARPSCAARASLLSCAARAPLGTYRRMGQEVPATMPDHVGLSGRSLRRRARVHGWQRSSRAAS